MQATGITLRTRLLRERERRSVCLYGEEEKVFNPFRSRFFFHYKRHRSTSNVTLTNELHSLICSFQEFDSILSFSSH